MKTLVILALMLAGTIPASGVAQGQAGVGRAFSLDMLRSTQTHIRFVIPAVFQFPEESSEEARPRRLGVATAPYQPPSDEPCIPDGYSGHAAAKPLDGGKTISVLSKGGKTHPLQADTSFGPVPSSCDSLFNEIILLNSERAWQQIYDSSKAYIETCYNSPNASLMFEWFRAAWMQIAGKDSAKMTQGQKWLESVLYLNTTDPEYFCACVESFGFWWPDTAGETHGWRAQNRGLALDRWLIENTTCDTPSIQGLYDGTRESQRDDWLNDTNVLLDTTLPALDSIEPGLEELLDRHLLYASVADRPPSAPLIISDASASPNPANTETVISFTMSKEAYVKIQLYDVLGKQLGNSAFESLFQPGNKSVPISLAGRPSGTYYARIVTAYGEVQTVKLVKQ